MWTKLFVVLFCLWSCLPQTLSFNARESMVGTPKKVIYIDFKGIDWSNPQNTVTSAVDAGYNVIILAFYLVTGPADMAVAWGGVSQSNQKTAMQYVHNKGAVVLVSAGGSTDSPYATVSGTAYGTAAANWANANNLDGVDFDMENFGPPLVYGSLSPQATIQWLIDATVAAKKNLTNAKIVTHAPQAPYFGSLGGVGKNTWTGSTGGYSAVYAGSADSTDWYNVQFYNQGSTCYVDYQGLFVDSSSCPPFPGTSVKEISSYGIPLNKIVVGKYLLQGDADNGWVDPATLGSYVKQASSIGWNAGVMGWLWIDASTSANWISKIYGNSPPSPPNPPPNSPTPPPTPPNPPPAPPSGSCAGKTGLFCVDSTHFQYCPQQITVQCSSGTVCQTVPGNNIYCGWPSK